MEQELRRRLIAVADAYQAGTGALSERTIGNRQLKNEGFIQGVRSAERGFNIRKYDQLMHWYADNWPDDASWPSDVPHPSQSNFYQSTPAVSAAGEGEATHG
jgi:hypothetical protein